MTTELAPANVRLTEGLGPLPPPFMELHHDFVPVVYEAWAHQMRAYALSERAVERERCARLSGEIERLREHQRQAMHDPDVCNGRMVGDPPRYEPWCVGQRTEIERLRAALDAKVRPVVVENERSYEL